MSKIEKKESFEENKLKKFKENVKEIITDEHNDEVLYKWLRARNFDLIKSEMLLRQDLASRQVCGNDLLADTYVIPEILKKFSCTGFLGQAKDGTPIRYAGFGRADLVGFLKSLNQMDILFYYMFIIEQDKKALKLFNENNGLHNNEITCIFDWDGLSLRQFAHQAVLDMAIDSFRLAQDYYPEIWKILINVNVPYFFTTLFNLTKSILRPTLLEKLRIVSKDGTKEELLKFVDADVLPAFLGGNRVDSNGDPYCSEFITCGGKIPEEYYLNSSRFIKIEDPGVECIVVTPRSWYNHSTVVREAGSRIHFETRSEEGAINAAFLYQKLEPNADHPKIPKSDEFLDETDSKSGVGLLGLNLKFYFDLAPLDNIFVCPWPGIYTMRYDNRSSWFQSKKLLIRVRVYPPNEHSMKCIGKFPFDYKITS